MDLIICVVYLAILGALSFLIGRIFPKRWFHWNAFPYRTFPLEKEGRIYTLLGIRLWHNQVPDMSRIFPRLMPPKTMPRNPDEATLVLMLQETCIAEMTHAFLIITGFGCLLLCPGTTGLVFSLLFAFGNLPFICVQRYNRPRLKKLLDRVTTRVGV